MNEVNPEPKSSGAAEAQPQPEAPAGAAVPATPKPGGPRRFLVLLLGAVVIYLAGYLPAKYQQRQLVREREAARREVRLKRIEVTLASSALDARRGEYEQARQEAAAFFTGLGEEVRSETPILDAGQRATMEELMRQRDELITLLARSDPASAERLANLYVTFRQALQKEAAPAPSN